VRIHHPSPAILMSAGFVPSSSGPFAPADCLAAPSTLRQKKIPVQPRQNTSHPLSPYAFAQTDLSLCQTRKAWNRFRGGPQRPLTPSGIGRSLRPTAGESPSVARHQPKPALPFRLTAPAAPTLPFGGHDETFRALLLFLRTLSPFSSCICHAHYLASSLSKSPEKDLREKAEKAAPSEKEDESPQIELLETR